MTGRPSRGDAAGGGVRLRRDTRALAWTGASLSAFGWGSAALAWLADTLGMYPGGVRYSPLFFYVTGPFIGALGLWQLLALLRRFRLTVDRDGLVVRTGRRTHRLEWSEIDSIEVAPDLVLKGRERWEQASLVVWTATCRRLAGLRTHHVDGRVGFVLLALDDFKEPPRQVIGALERHGGEKIDAAGYLNYCESRQRFAEYLRELEAEIEARKTGSDNPAT